MQESQVKERPILFSAPMVRAILDGRKTQTRRIVKDSHFKRLGLERDGEFIYTTEGQQWNGEFEGGQVPWCPYGTIGDRLWVRETWCSPGGKQIGYTADGKCGAWCDDGDGGQMFLDHGRIVESPKYKECFPANGSRSWGISKYGGKWRPSIHMPRWASRITLEITDVRVERLQDISPEGVAAEGVFFDEPELTVQFGVDVEARFCMSKLWESINGEGSWNANPWVWVVAFERVKQ